MRSIERTRRSVDASQRPGIQNSARTNSNDTCVSASCEICLFSRHLPFGADEEKLECEQLEQVADLKPFVI